MSRITHPTDTQLQLLICATREPVVETGVLYVDEAPDSVQIRAGGVTFRGAQAMNDLRWLQEHEFVTVRGAPTGSGARELFLTTRGAEAAKKTLAEWTSSYNRLSQDAKRVLQAAGQQAQARHVVLHANLKARTVRVDSIDVPVGSPEDCVASLESGSFIQIFRLSPDEVGEFVMSPKGLTVAELQD